MPSKKLPNKNNWVARLKKLGWSDFLFVPFLFLSILFWLSTELSSEISFRKTLPVRFISSPDRVIKNPMPDELTARMEGKGWDLIFLKRFTAQNPFVFEVDSNMLYLSKADLLTALSQQLDDENITLSDVYFENQAIRQERKLVKKVPIVFAGELEFAPFHKMLGEVGFFPDSVTLTGPESDLVHVENYPIVLQKLVNIQRDIKKTVALKKPLHSYILLDPPAVEMNLHTEQMTQKTLTIPVTVANPGQEAITIIPRDIQISFLIGLSEFSAVAESDFSAQIFLPDEIIPNQQYAVSIVKKPTGVVIQEMTPAYVDVFYAH